MLKSFFPDEVKIDITIDDIRLKSISTTSKTIRFTKTSFFQYETWFYTIPLRTSKRLCRICSINSRTKKSYRPIDNTGIDKFHTKCDCENGTIVYGIREPIFYSFALDKPLGLKRFKNQELN